jgi:hypothetical protein
MTRDPVVGEVVVVEVGLDVIGADEGAEVTGDEVLMEVGAGVDGDLVGTADVGEVVLGDLVGWTVVEDDVVVTVAPVLTVVEVVEEGFEQPAVRLTSANTASDHDPPTSC